MSDTQNARIRHMTAGDSPLIFKLKQMLKDAREQQLWGTIEIELRRGVPVLLYKKVAERLINTEESPRAERPAQSEDIY